MFADPEAKVLGHLALHYRTPEDGPRAAKLLDLLGLQRKQEIPFGGGMIFYQYTLANDPTGRGIGTLFLSLVPGPIAELTKAIGSTLKVGTPEEHPAVTAYRQGQVQDPEMNFHIGLMFNSLEEVERLIARLEAANESDPDLKGRFKFSFNRAMEGDPEIDARMAASPIFGKTERRTYGRFGCQAFVETDLLAGGLLGENMVIELDYVFPNRAENMFVKSVA